VSWRKGVSISEPAAMISAIMCGVGSFRRAIGSVSMILVVRRFRRGTEGYLKALMLYAQYLHESRQLEPANVIERKIRQAEAVVDVHTIRTSQGMFGLDGLH
jgi:hypothetical protein